MAKDFRRQADNASGPERDALLQKAQTFFQKVLWNTSRLLVLLTFHAETSFSLYVVTDTVFLLKLILDFPLLGRNDEQHAQQSTTTTEFKI